MVCTAAVLFAACTKEAVNKTQKSATGPALKTMSGTGPTATREWRGDLGDCVAPAKNCSDDVNVDAVMQHLSDAITGAYVESYMNSDEAVVLEDYFGSTIFNQLKEGSYTLMQYDNTAARKLFFLAGPVGSLSMKNAEFVIPVAY